MLVQTETSMVILKNNMKVPRKCKTELPYDPEIPLWGIYSQEIEFICQIDNCASMFNSALFPIAEMQKQPKCTGANG